MTRRIQVPAQRLPAPGGRALLHTGERCVVLFEIAGAYHAIDDRCPHQGASLAGGRLEGRRLQCPAHGLRFDVASGCMGPAGPALTVYPVHVEADGVFIELPD